MMALFTTTPASEMIPMPVLMIPNGIWKTIRPSSTPIVDMSTDVRMTIGFTTELNWQLEVARFLAPGVMAYTATQALIVLFREQLSLLRLRFARASP